MFNPVSKAPVGSCCFSVFKHFKCSCKRVDIHVKERQRHAEIQGELIRATGTAADVKREGGKLSKMETS